MDKEDVRKSLNTFLKMYFAACKEVYEEMDFKELTGKQFAYLRKIDKEEKITMSDLAKHFNLSKPSVTEMIKKFEETKLIERTKCTKDLRVQFISLTEQGRLLARTNILESKRAVEKIFAALKEEEILKLTELFDKIGQ